MISTQQFLVITLTVISVIVSQVSLAEHDGEKKRRTAPAIVGLCVNLSKLLTMMKDPSNDKLDEQWCHEVSDREREPKKCSDQFVFLPNPPSCKDLLKEQALNGAAGWRDLRDFIIQMVFGMNGAVVTCNKEKDFLLAENKGLNSALDISLGGLRRVEQILRGRGLRPRE